MANHTSRYAIVSFAALLLAIVLLIVTAVASQLTSYSAYKHDSLVTQLAQVSFVAMCVCFLVSFATAIVALRRKDSSPVIPTISLSVFSFATFLIVLILALDQSTISHADKGIVTNFGLFEIPNFPSKSGKLINLYEQRFLIANTDQIPATKGTRFGFNYVITGEPTTGKVNLVKITKYPEPGLNRNNAYVHADTIQISQPLNTLDYSGFKFEYDYELLPGKWQIELWDNNKMLLSRPFYVHTAP